MRIFFILATILASIWFAWRVGEDITDDDTSFSVMFLHLMLFFFSYFVGLVLIG